MNRSNRCRAMAVVLACGLASVACGQAAPDPSHDVELHKSSGLLRDAAAPAKGNEQVRVWSTAVNIPGAQWLRLHFSPETLLAGKSRQEGGSYLVITSALDGDKQYFDSTSLAEYSNISAYLNGDALLVELFAAPGMGDNRVEIVKATAGDAGNTESICGGTDDRVPDNDPRVGRLSIGCTGWLIAENGNTNEFLTAGHCLSVGQVGVMQMFNIPAATAAGGFVAPPVEFQFPVQSASIQRQDTGTGNDWAHYQTNRNSNTGMSARMAQGQAAYFLASAAPAGGVTDTVVRGHGIINDQAGIPAIDWEWNRINKVHTAAYAGKVGTRIDYWTDTENGNSGSPVTQFTGLFGIEQAIGIHTSGFCPGSPNSGTAIEHANLQAAIASPSGVDDPYMSAIANEFDTIFVGTNGGSDGGAVYFDVEVGTHSLEIQNLWLNINHNTTTNNGTAADDDDFFTFDVYTTPNTCVGKQTNAALWTKVATGGGMPRGEDFRTLGALENTFTLDASKSYGVAIVFTDGAAHRYTNGDGTNEVHVGTDMTITGVSASNAPFTGNISSRVFNGGFGYIVNETQGQCIETLFAQNNGGGNGGIVYFDVDVGSQPITLTGINTNVEGAGGLDCDIEVYRASTTYVGKEDNAALWTLVATGSAVSNAVDTPTPFQFDNFHSLAANTGYGLAIVLTTSGTTEGHAYTNGTGLNQNYKNDDLELTLGAANNAPFIPSPFSPRVWNGSLCYGVGINTICKDQLLSQTVPHAGTFNPFNSNTTGQQEADEMAHATQDWKITGATFWGAYSNVAVPPVSQAFSVRFYDNAGGLPGALVATRNVSNIAIKDTGLFTTAFGDPIYQYDVTFASPVLLQEGTHWISALGDTAGATWAWARTNGTPNEHAVRPDGSSSWALSSGDFAFVLCGTVIAQCYADCEEDFDLDVFDFLCFQGNFAANTAYGDCEKDGDWDVFDFLCFQGKYAAGCTF